MTTSPAALTAPGSAVTVTNFYKQNVYDQADSKIGEIADVLVDKEGHHHRPHRLGRRLPRYRREGRLGAVHRREGDSQKDNKWYLVMNTTKDALKTAPGYRYDKTSTTWVAEKS